MRNKRCSYQVLISALMVLFTNAASATSQSFRENADLSIVLSQNNINRLVVKGDKITQAHFPVGALDIQHDEDGGLYVSVANHAPFTMFVDTESGHHFSATVSTEEALGKTVEFVPKQLAQGKTLPTIKSQSAQDAIPKADTITSLMTSMIGGQAPNGYEQKNHYGRVKRLNQGLVLTPKSTFTGMEFKGEVFELYNGGRRALDLQENWFSDATVKAVSLSSTTLAPKQTAKLYRVSQVNHG